MRICIPTQTNIGRQAQVHEHFGSAPFFTIYDVELDICEIVDNSDRHHAHGMCHPLGVLDGKNINAVICSGMGKRAVQKLNEGGVRAYRASGARVQDIVKECRESKLEEITVENACGHHGGCHQ
ncbi:MAG: NifB/NifX family molybdenum-iron cluster-binding protein [Planctomycetota bacterium]|jgi:predicted Fe-Mo cluster-binding NifX family protein